MGLSSKIRKKINFTIIATSILVWVVLFKNPGQILGKGHCHVSGTGESATSLQTLLEANPFSALMLGWGLMVIAMMLPKLIIPIQFIYARSLVRLRFLSALVFVFGYMTIWMVVGIFMNAAIVGLQLLMPNSFLPAIVCGIIAIVWQFSPTKQRFLNKGHDHQVLAAFGWPAIRDAFQFGVSHGIWCVGAGWALMLFPMLLPMGHNLAMVIVTFIMISEHLEHPKMPRWHIDFRGKLFRFVAAQIQIGLKQKLNLKL